jgi:HD superfamily phosphohydrolase
LPIPISDKLYGEIRLEDWEYKLATTPEMQRINGIKQLGLSYIQYPGANHTRYEHSLGVTHLVGMVIDHIIQTSSSEIKKEVGRYKNCLRATALLHDCGHSPFSHTLNELTETLSGKSHEKISAEIVQCSSRISNILKSNSVEVDDVVAILVPIDGFHIPYMQELISGVIDVDRIDYLNRDSERTNTAHGIIDYRSIISSMKIKTILPEGYDKTVKALKGKLVKEDEGIEKILTEMAKVDRKLAETASKALDEVDKRAAEILKESHIVLDSGVRHSAIGLLMAREVMYPLVYRNPETRAAEGVFTKMVEYCIEKNFIDPHILYDAQTIVKNCDSNILINDGYLESLIRNVNDSYIKEMLRFFDSHNFLYPAFQAAFWDVKRLRQRIRDIIYSTDAKRRGILVKELLNDISSQVDIDYWHMTIDILPIKEQKGLANALIELPNGEVKPLVEASSVVYGLRNSSIENWCAVIRMPEKVDGKDFAYNQKVHDKIADIFFVE